MSIHTAPMRFCTGAAILWEEERFGFVDGLDRITDDRVQRLEFSVGALPVMQNTGRAPKDWITESTEK